MELNENLTLFAVPEAVVLIEKTTHLIEPKYTWRTKNYSISSGPAFDTPEEAQAHAEQCLTADPVE